MQGINENLNNITNRISSSFDMAEMLSYNIWGAAVTTTRAFEKVTLKVDPDNQRIFVGITLRWMFRFKKFERIQNIWLQRAEKRCQEQIPEGWKLLVYFIKEAK